MSRPDWQRYAAKLEALSLRECILVFCAAFALLAFVADLLLIGPVRAGNKALAAQIAQQQGEIQAARSRIQALVQASGQDPDAPLRARIEQVRTQIAQSDAVMQQAGGNLVAPEKMAGVLEEILSRNKRLQLVNLATLPASALLEVPVQGEKGMEKNLRARGVNIYKHGVELTVQGSYLDLLEYLVQLEKLPWQMLWGKASMNADQYPRVLLTVTVYTLSSDKAWLVV